MVFDFDDFAEDNHKLHRFLELKEINPDFRCTLFAIPGKCSPEFLASLPDWMELAVHGWMHPHPYECENWSAEYLGMVLEETIIKDYFVQGFKAPGWQISDGCYEELLRRRWWVADQHLEDRRRPKGLRTYFYEDGNAHYHVQDWGSNGIDESWDSLSKLVRECERFEFASEAAR